MNEDAAIDGPPQQKHEDFLIPQSEERVVEEEHYTDLPESALPYFTVVITKQYVVAAKDANTALADVQAMPTDAGEVTNFQVFR